MPRTARPSARAIALFLAAPLAGVLALGGCAGSPSAADPDAETTPAAAGHPVTVDNCGVEVTFDAAPERVVTIKSTTTELLLALGLGDRIVGSAFLDGPVPEQWESAAAELHVISDKVPGQEATLDLEPDLVFAGWESNLTAEGAGDRELLASLGVNTLVAASACKGAGYMPNPMSFELLFDEFAEVGEIFGATDAASALVAEQRAALDAVEPSTAGLTALWYSSGTDIPYVGAGIGAPQMIMQAAGLENIAAEVEDTWTSLSWEAVVDADPDVIVLVDALWNSAEAKIALLEANAATASLPAVQQERYLIVPFPAGEAGVRNVDAVASLVAQLRTLAP